MELHNRLMFIMVRIIGYEVVERSNGEMWCSQDVVKCYVLLQF